MKSDKLNSLLLMEFVLFHTDKPIALLILQSTVHIHTHPPHKQYTKDCGFGCILNYVFYNYL